MHEHPEGEYALYNDKIKLFAPANRDELLIKALKISEAANAYLWQLRAAAKALVGYCLEDESRSQEYINSPLHPANHVKAILEETPYAVLADVQRDAERYHFLRIEDDWGEDSGEDSWCVLGECNGVAFDKIVDSRIRKANSDGAKK
jgi:hypothetical protein